MSDQPLRTTTSDELSPLMVDEEPVFYKFGILTKILAKEFGEDFVQLFAEPRQEGLKTDWYTDCDQCRRFDELTDAEQTDLIRKLRSSISKIETIINKYEKNLSENKDSGLISIALRESLKIPDKGFIYSSDGRPVLIGWSFVGKSDARSFDLLNPENLPVEAEIPPTTKAEPVQSEKVATEEPVKESGRSVVNDVPQKTKKKRRFGCIWCCLLLPLLTLLAGFLLGCYYCGWLCKTNAGESGFLSFLGNLTCHSEQPAPDPAPPVDPPEPVPSDVPQPVPDTPEILTAEGFDCSPYLDDVPTERIVFVLDGSLSMNDVDRATLFERLQELLKGTSPSIRIEESRIALAKKALASITESLPDQTEIGLVAFQHCDQIVQSDITPVSQSTILEDIVWPLQPVGKTPLGASVLIAAEAIERRGWGDEEASIIVITDGEESCHDEGQRYPCQVAQELNQRFPKLRINVIDITGSQSSSCLAEQTGGFLFTARNTEGLIGVLRQASGQEIPAACLGR